MKIIAVVCSLVSVVAFGGSRSELEPRPTAGISSVTSCDSKLSVGSKETLHGKCKLINGFVHPRSSSKTDLVDRKSKQ